eukprot:355494-Chlamydomonas_euryale.AAC.5
MDFQVLLDAETSERMKCDVVRSDACQDEGVRQRSNSYDTVMKRLARACIRCCNSHASGD